MDSPSQNDGAEIYNGKLAIWVCTLLYVSGLPVKFWSATLLHAIYLHNQLVHSATNKTPYKSWHGWKPDLSHLKTIGSRVCVKQSGSWRCKLDKHDFTEIFLSYTATHHNIVYLDMSSGIIKLCPVFNVAWYLQDVRPLAAQLLYDLGLEADTDPTSADEPIPPPLVGNIETITVPCPPLCDALTNKKWLLPPLSLYLPLPLWVAAVSTSIAAKAAHVMKTKPPPCKRTLASAVITKYLIGPHTMKVVYMSLDPYSCAFEATLDLCKCNLASHRTGRLCFLTKNGCLILATMDPGTPGARVCKWRTQLLGVMAYHHQQDPCVHPFQHTVCILAGLQDQCGLMPTPLLTPRGHSRHLQLRCPHYVHGRLHPVHS